MPEKKELSRAPSGGLFAAITPLPPRDSAFLPLAAAKDDAASPVTLAEVVRELIREHVRLSGTEGCHCPRGSKDWLPEGVIGDGIIGDRPRFSGSWGAA